MSNTMGAILCVYKLSAAYKFPCGIRELHATLIVFCNIAGIKKMAATLKNPFTIRDPYKRQCLSNLFSFRRI
jgi:hypothetical protein